MPSVAGETPTCQRSFMWKSSGMSLSRMASPWSGPNCVCVFTSVLATTPSPCTESRSSSDNCDGKLNCANDLARNCRSMFSGNEAKQVPELLPKSKLMVFNKT